MRSRKKNNAALPAAITVVGPTASGKSDLAVEIAKFIRRRWPAFTPIIISADSRQVYRGLDIGSGKITKKEMGGIPHFLLDVADPKRVYSAARYQRDVRHVLRSLAKTKNILPIIVGGTGQYVDAVISGISFPAVKPDLELRRALDALSTGELFGRLRAADPARAALIDRRNRPRLIRALEIISATGSPVPATIRQSAEHLLFHRVLKIGIRFPREQLKERIRVRLAKRLRMGLIAEVKALHAAGLSWKRLDDLGLEYRFVARHLRGILSKEEMVAQLESAITAYAKRQMTWFKRDKDIVWFDRIPPSSAWNPIVRKFVLLFR